MRPDTSDESERETQQVIEYLETAYDDWFLTTDETREQAIPSQIDWVQEAVYGGSD